MERTDVWKLMSCQWRMMLKRFRLRLRKGFEYLDSVYLGNNESADYITENLNLVDAIDELGLTVSWDMENEDYVNYKGEIVNEKLETPVLLNLTATLSYEDFQASRQYPGKIGRKGKK